MKRRKKDDFELDSKAHLSGILYTTRRSTIRKGFYTKEKKEPKGIFRQSGRMDAKRLPEHTKEIPKKKSAQDSETHAPEIF